MEKPIENLKRRGTYSVTCTVLLTNVLIDFPENLCGVLDVFFHFPFFANVIIEISPIEWLCDSMDYKTFMALKQLFVEIRDTPAGEYILLDNFLTVFCEQIDITLETISKIDIVALIESFISLFANTIPPFRDYFSPVTSTNFDINELFVRVPLSEDISSLDDYLERISQMDFTSARMGVEETNFSVLRGVPPILMFSVESNITCSHWKQINPKPEGYMPSSSSPPSQLVIPQEFDMCNHFSYYDNVEGFEINDSFVYDLFAVISLSGSHPRYSTVETDVYVVVGCEMISEDEVCAEHFWCHCDNNTGINKISDEGTINRTFDCVVSAPRVLIYARAGTLETLLNYKEQMSPAAQLQTLTEASFDAVYRNVGDFEDATKLYKAALEHDPSLEGVLTDYFRYAQLADINHKVHSLEADGDCRVFSGNLDEALHVYEQCLNEMEEKKHLYYDHVFEKHETISVMRILEEAFKSVESMKEHIQNENFEAAKQDCDNALTYQPSNAYLQKIRIELEEKLFRTKVSSLYSQACLAMKNGKHKMAFEYFQQVLQMDSAMSEKLECPLAELQPLIRHDEGMEFSRQGLSYFNEKKYDLAISMYTNAIEVLQGCDCVDDYLNVLIHRTQAWMELQDYSRALMDCKEALSVRNDHPMAIFSMGMISFLSESFDEAIVMFEKAMLLDTSLQESGRAKIRQCKTAKEVFLRKQREKEREKAKQEEMRILHEKKVKLEAIKKEKALRLQMEKNESSERARMKQEDKLSKLFEDRCENDDSILMKNSCQGSNQSKAMKDQSKGKKKPKKDKKKGVDQDIPNSIDESRESMAGIVVDNSSASIVDRRSESSGSTAIEAISRDSPEHVIHLDSIVVSSENSSPLMNELLNSKEDMFSMTESSSPLLKDTFVIPALSTVMDLPVGSMSVFDSFESNFLACNESFGANFSNCNDYDSVSVKLNSDEVELSSLVEDILSSATGGISNSMSLNNDLDIFSLAPQSSEPSEPYFELMEENIISLDRYPGVSALAFHGYSLFGTFSNGVEWTQFALVIPFECGYLFEPFILLEWMHHCQCHLILAEDSKFRRLCLLISPPLFPLSQPFHIHIGILLGYISRYLEYRFINSGNFY